MTVKRIFILANDDLTSNLIFSRLFAVHGLNVVGVAFDSMNYNKTQFPWSIFKLLNKMAFAYWIYLVYTNICYKIFCLLTMIFNLSTASDCLHSLKALAKRQGVPIFKHAEFNDSNFIQIIKNLDIDLLIVRCNTILKSELLHSTRYGAWCVHSSLLPGYRGIAGEFHAMRCGEKELGTSIFQVEETLDTGKILFRNRLRIHKNASLFKMMIKNNAMASAMLAHCITSGEKNSTYVPDEIHYAPNYHSWPTKNELRQFRNNGYQLITFTEASSLLRRALTRPRSNFGTLIALSLLSSTYLLL